MSAYFRAPKTQAYFSDPATFSGSTLVSISSVSAVRLGEVFTITTDGAVNLTTATVISATLGGITLAGIAGITANTVNFNAPSAGLQLGANHDLIITVDGSSSAASAQAFLPPTGKQFVTLVSIDSESKFAVPPYSGNGGVDADNMGAGDQPYIDLVSSPDGYSVSISNTGIIDLIGASEATQNQTVNVAYLDAQDSYASSGTTVLTLEIPPSDVTAPVITLLGPTTVTHAHGTAYADAGATATDDTDGDITVNIAVTGSVNTNVVGSYVLSYNVSDAAGNAATTVIRTVNVTDQAIPVITLLGAASVTVNEGSTYVDAGATATDGVDGDLTSSIVTGNSVNTAVPGNYSVTYDVSDAAGNAATQITRTVVVEALDSIAPVITLTGEQSITLTQGGTYEEQGATWADNIDGNGSAVVGGDTVDTQTPGTYTITYNYTDAAGNAANQVTRTVVVAAPTISVNSENPLPLSIVLNNLTPYQLSQHILNPEGKSLKYTISQAGTPLNPGVVLNEDTGALSLTTGTNSTVDGIILNVREI